MLTGVTLPGAGNFGVRWIGQIKQPVSGGIVLAPEIPKQRFLGRRDLIAMKRWMEMLLIAFAVQMLLEGISGYLVELR